MPLRRGSAAAGAAAGGGCGAATIAEDARTGALWQCCGGGSGSRRVGCAVVVTPENFMSLTEPLLPGDEWLVLRSSEPDFGLILDQLNVLPALLDVLGVRLAISATTSEHLIGAATALQCGGGRGGGGLLLLGGALGGAAADGGGFIGEKSDGGGAPGEADAALLLRAEAPLWRIGQMLLGESTAADAR